MIDAAMLELAARQQGVLATWQLRELLGVSTAAVSRARRSGKIVDMAPGVVRIRSSPDTHGARCFAMHLRVADLGFLSGATAGHQLGLRSMPTRRVEVTVDRSFRRTMPTWARVHPSSWFCSERDSQRGPGGMTIATPMRMLWGLAASFNQHRFERAAEDAWHLGLITPAQALAYLEVNRCRGKDGVRRLELWLDRAIGQQRPAQSNLERVLLEAVQRCGLSEPIRQHQLLLSSGELISLDIAWPHIRLAVEPGDSWWHGGDDAQRHDQARDRACNEVGWQVVRFDQTLRTDPDAAARQVARIHRQRTFDVRNCPDS